MIQSTVIPVVFVGIFIAALILFVYISKKGVGKKIDSAWYQEQWRQIEDTFLDGKAGQMLAVVNADKLLDKAMQERGLKGSTMGDRLKQNSDRFTGLNNIWSAHKLRNRIAHESSISVNESDARSALQSFNQALKNLGVL